MFILTTFRTSVNSSSVRELVDATKLLIHEEVGSAYILVTILEQIDKQSLDNYST